MEWKGNSKEKKREREWLLTGAKEGEALRRTKRGRGRFGQEGGEQLNIPRWLDGGRRNRSLHSDWTRLLRSPLH